jgi:hypothetical protein
MKAYWGVHIEIHVFLTSSIDRGEWSASRPGCLTPGERVPGTHRVGGWIGTKTNKLTVLSVYRPVQIGPQKCLETGTPLLPGPGDSEIS